jgi:hypothetical protein
MTWKDPLEQYLTYTGIAIETLAFLLVLYSFKWKVSIIKVCIAMMHVRIILVVFKMEDIFRDGQTPRRKMMETLIASGLIFTNKIMILHCYTAKKGMIFVGISFLVFLWGFNRIIYGGNKFYFAQVIKISVVSLFFMYFHIKLSNLHLDVLIDNSKTISELRGIEKVQKETE